MYKKGKYFAHKFTIGGEAKIFYSSQTTKTAAWVDICEQKTQYEEKLHKHSHNFKCLADKMLEWQQGCVRYKCIESYRNGLRHLERFYGRDIESITALEVQALLDDMAMQKYSFSLISKTKTVYGLILKYAILYEGLQINNYMSIIKVPKNAPRGKITSPPDLVIDKILKTAYSANFGLWAASLLCTGFRRGELNAIRRRDVDFDRAEINLHSTTEFVHNRPILKAGAKSDDGVRTQPILEIYRPFLEKLCENLSPDDFLFGGAAPLTETQIKKRWTKYCKELGHTFTGHQLRHAYALLLYRAGYDPKTMQRLLGHADFSTTMNIYTDFSKEVEAEKLHMLNEYMAKKYAN